MNDTTNEKTGVYNATLIVTSEQHIRFEAPAGMTEREAYIWWISRTEQELDAAIIRKNDETVVDTDIEIDD